MICIDIRQVNESAEIFKKVHLIRPRSLLALLTTSCQTLIMKLKIVISQHPQILFLFYLKLTISTPSSYNNILD